MFKMTVSGNLVADCEKRYTADGKAMISFRFAANVRERNEDKEWEDKGYFFRVTTMPSTDKAVDYLESTLEKGARVLVSGQPKLGIWDGKNGPQLSMDLAFPDVLEVFPRSSGRRDDDEEEERPQRRANGNGDSSPSRSGGGSSRAKRQDETDLNDLPF